MAFERSRGSFNTTKMAHVLDGGEQRTKLRKEVMKELEETELLRPSRRFDMDRPTYREQSFRKIRDIWGRFMLDGVDLERREARVEVFQLADPSWATRNGVHFGLFVNCITSNASQEQQEEWLPLAMTLQMLGSFSMTELGHGSFVRGLETTATFVPGAGPDGDGEFVINTPSVEATKWWIGGAAHMATHTVVFARLLLPNGEDKGVHVFLTRLRTAEDHELMPGVVIGDCGEKMGRDGIDNGWIQFHSVRVPRSAMLCRHAQVSKEGAYSRPPKPQLAYGALILGRAYMVKDSADWLKMALTIVIRYAAVRRQGAPFAAPDSDLGRNRRLADQSDPTDPRHEPQVLDYSNMQRRLLPLLATAYAFHFTSAYMMALHRASEEALSASDISNLPAVHATSAGLKAFCTWQTQGALEVCRQSCGGHGYSKYNALSSMVSDFAVVVSWEGDNTVLALQTARYLVRRIDEQIDAHRKGKTPKELPKLLAYLQGCGPEAASGRQQPSKPSSARSAADMQATAHLVAALRANARSSVLAAHRTLTAARKARESSGPGWEARAWNAAAPELLEASRAHVTFCVAEFFQTGARARLEHASAAEQPALQAVLDRLLGLFAAYKASKARAQLLSSGHLTPDQSEWVASAVGRLCDAVRPEAVSLVDSFQFSDALVAAPIGRADGDIYPAYLHRVLEAPNPRQKAPYYEEVIRPVVDGTALAEATGMVGGDSDEEDEHEE